MKYAAAVAALMFGAQASDNFLNEIVDGPIAELARKNGGIWKTCPKTTAEQNFDKEKYVGVWYELHRAKVQTQEDGECVTATYSSRDDGLVGVENSHASMTTKTRSRTQMITSTRTSITSKRRWERLRR